MPLESSPAPQRLQNAVIDAELEWLLCLASALQTCQRQIDLRQPTPKAASTPVRPPLKTEEQNSRVA